MCTKNQHGSKIIRDWFEKVYVVESWGQNNLFEIFCTKHMFGLDTDSEFTEF
jgi:hypothetical protein